MHAVCADTICKRGISSDQQRETARTACLRQGPRHCDPVASAKMAIDHSRVTREALHCFNRVGRAVWIGEEIERRQGRGASLAVEAAC